MAIFLIIKTPEGLSNHELGDEPVVIGRSDEADITIKDPNISSQHLEVSKRNRGVYVLDLGSKNGTFIHGQRISNQMITLDDVVQFGTCYLSVDKNQLNSIELIAMNKGKRMAGQDLTLPLLKPGQDKEKSREMKRHSGFEDKSGVSVVTKEKKLPTSKKKKAK